MEKQSWRENRTEEARASKQQQLRAEPGASGAPAAATVAQQATASGQTARAHHFDPIQSIANVLNHHHSEFKAKQGKQQPAEVKKFVASPSAKEQQSGDGSGAVDEGSKAFASQQPKPQQAQVQPQQGRAAGAHSRSPLLAPESGNPVAKRAPARQRLTQQVAGVRQLQLVSGRDNLQEGAGGEGGTLAESASAGFQQARSKQQHARNSSATALEATDESSLNATYKSSQVEQGNSYLYAYNDFITPHSAHLSSVAGGAGIHKATRSSGASGYANKAEATEHNLKVARLSRPAEEEGREAALRRKTKPAKSVPSNAVCLLTGEALSAPRQIEGRREAFGASRFSSHQEVVGKDGHEEGEVATDHQYDQDHNEDEDEDEDDDEDDDDEENDCEDTLSYILNKHSLLAATNSQHPGCNLLHLTTGNANGHQQHANVNLGLICNHSKQQLLAAATENPNHLRQYLQIEENFNSYKAARRRARAFAAANGLQFEAQDEGRATARQRLLAGQGLDAANNDALRDSLLGVRQQKATLSALPPPQTIQTYRPQLPHLQLAADTAPKTNLSSSSLSSSLSSLAKLTTGRGTDKNQVSLLSEHQLQQQHLIYQQQHQRPLQQRGYLQFLSRFAPVSFGAPFGALSAQKMYAANSAQLAAGQPGAYYVTTTGSVAGGAEEALQQQQQQQHEHQQHNHMQQHLHQLNLSQQSANGAGHALPTHLHHAHAHLPHAHHRSHNGNHHHHHHHHHQQQQQHSYPITSASDSSLNSSGVAFASSAMRRTTGWLRDFCSKKCLFISCLMLIMFVFILVISISAYLNFLINSNKTNLQPLSGRLRVMLDVASTSASEDQADGGGGSGEHPSAAALAATSSLRELLASASNVASNKTMASDFTQSRRDFETILRGALDRTQPILKTYPNHLVKLEVYSLKPASAASGGGTNSNSNSNSNSNANGLTPNDLWVYFRLFINKRTLQLDSQLMKRKSPDEHFDRQFLPRLTQQTLLNGFEQLITSFGLGGALSSNRLILSGEPAATAAGSSAQLGINSRRFGQTPSASGAELAASRRSSRAAALASGHPNYHHHHQFAAATAPGGVAVGRQQNAAALTSSQRQQQQQLKSFDEQISRLMHLIEAIDLQSIFVTPEFDMIQTMAAALPTSETLRASQAIRTTTSASPTIVATSAREGGGNFMPANGSPASAPAGARPEMDGGGGGGGDKSLQPAQQAQSTTATSAIAPAAGSNQPADSQTRKFTLSQSYRENATRPSLSVSAAGSTPSPPTTARAPTSSGSPFLVNQQQKPARTTAEPSANGARPAQQRQKAGAVVRLVAGQPVASQAVEQLAADRQRPSLAKAELQQPSANASSIAASVSIPDLWQNAFGGKQNVSTLVEIGSPDGRVASPSSSPSDLPNVRQSTRLITVTTVGGGGSSNVTSSSPSASSARRQQQPPSATNATRQSASEWLKVSVSDSGANGAGLGGGSAQRARLNAPSSAAGQNNQQASANASAGALESGGEQKVSPKVSPHLNFAGSLVTATSANNASQRTQQRLQQSSAVVLNRDVAGINSTATTTLLSRNPQQASNQQQQKLKQQQQQQRLVVGANDSVRAPANSTAPRSNTFSGQKPAKVKKKVATAPATASAINGDGAKNQTVPELKVSPGAPINAKGIRIVENFLASIGSSQLPTSEAPAQAAPANRTRTAATAQQQVLAAATLPTTIELTRATTPPSSATTDLSAGFIIASQQARPGTTSFSGQWRPLGGGGDAAEVSSGNNNEPGADFWTSTAAAPNNSARAPASRTRLPSTGSLPPHQNANLSLIVASEHIPPTALGNGFGLGSGISGAGGSQSPFAMPNAAVIAPAPPQAPPPHFSNRFRAGGATTAGPPTNDFESHRVSRMRQSQAHSHRTSDLVDPFGMSSSASVSSSSSSSATSTSTSSSLAAGPGLADPPNTRVVDDFMITTERNDGVNGRATTLLPPLVLSGFHNSASMAGVAVPGRARLEANPAAAISLVVAQGPKRTRGPFAFETLRSFLAPVASSSAPPGESLASPSEPAAPETEAPSLVSARAERSSSPLSDGDGINAQEKLSHLDKRLSLAANGPSESQEQSHAAIEMSLSSGAEEDLTFSPSTSSPVSTHLNSNQGGGGEIVDIVAEIAGRFGNRFSSQPSNNTVGQLGLPFKRRQRTASASGSDKCPFFGCKPRGQLSEPIVCLNQSQICDDFIDCQDESDELDCVSLLKFNAATNKMTFSNGAGIVYLNRRGSFAPMCLEFGENGSSAASEQTLSAGRRLSGTSANESTLKQMNAELIRQINTVGQYACNLQSFSHLVSVKINHHSQVDGSNQIKSSKLFHRLSVVLDEAGSGGQGSKERPSDRVQAETSAASFKSSGQYQVQITTSSECPSQRTVFVKCGSFECGQDSFKRLEQQESYQTSGGASENLLALDARRLVKSDTALRDFPWLVKLYHLNSPACLGYLIDESWLIAASNCFAATTSGALDSVDDGFAFAKSSLEAGDWTAEISNEHYHRTDDDSELGDSNRRRVVEVLVQAQNDADDITMTTTPTTSTNQNKQPSGWPAAIVLAKLGRSVRFSPSNRPICLPTALMKSSANRTTTTTGNKFKSESDRANYKECITAALPAMKQNSGRGLNLAPTLPAAAHFNAPPTRQMRQHLHFGLVLNKVELLANSEDCFQNQQHHNHHQQGEEQQQVRRDLPVSNLICANEIKDHRAHPSAAEGTDEEGDLKVSPNFDGGEVTRVLICSQQPAQNASSQTQAQLRSKRWVVVGFELKQLQQGRGDDQMAQIRPNSLLFTSVSSQIDWIVDTMNPKSVPMSSGESGSRINSNNFDGEHNSFQSNFFNHRLSSNSSMAGVGGDQHQTNKLNPLFNSNNNNNHQQQQTCNRFKCSSGECLSWSRICDGLYDCSSQDDEKDCHK